MFMVLKVKWTEFKSSLENFQSEGNALIKKYKAARTEDLLNELKEEKQSWESDVISYVKASFDPEHTNFAYEFKAQQGYNFGMKLGIDQRVKNTIQTIKDEINGLDYYLKICY